VSPDPPARRGDPRLADTAGATRDALEEPYQHWPGQPEHHEGRPWGRLLMLGAVIVVGPAVGAGLLALVAWLYLTFAI
jgi:hypothetical protein